MAWTDEHNCHSGPHPGLGLAHPHIYPMEDLLKLLNSLIVWKEKRKLSMTLGNHGISKRNFGDDGVPETRVHEPDQ